MVTAVDKSAITRVTDVCHRFSPRGTYEFSSFLERVKLVSSYTKS